MVIEVNRTLGKLRIISANGLIKDCDLLPSVMIAPDGHERDEVEIREEILKRIPPEQWRGMGFNVDRM
jgi:hypothetical protein